MPDLEKVGFLTFTFADRDDELLVHVFRGTSFEGTPTETEEMKPQWFETDKIPFEQMWADDEYWFPYLLGGVKFKGSFHFDAPATSEHSGLILRSEIVEVDDF